jgi:hypothetical protein
MRKPPAFKRAALEERELERGAKDIKDAEFEPRDDPDGSADTPGSLADFVVEGGDGEARSWEAVGRMREAFPSDDEVELPEHMRSTKRRRTMGEDVGRAEPHRELTPIRTRAPSPERSREGGGSFGGGSSARSTPSVPRGAPDLPFEAEMDEVVAKLPAPFVLAKVPSREEQHRVFVIMRGLRKAVLQYKARVGKSVDDLCGFRGSSTSAFLIAVSRLLRALPEVDRALTLSDAGVSLVDAMQRALRKYEGVLEGEGQGRRQRKETGRLLLLTYLRSQFFVSGY